MHHIKTQTGIKWCKKVKKNKGKKGEEREGKVGGREYESKKLSFNNSN